MIISINERTTCNNFRALALSTKTFNPPFIFLFTVLIYFAVNTPHCFRL